MTSDLIPGTMVSITVKYTYADLEACGGEPDKLILSRYDADAADWIMLSTTADTENMTLTATTDQFSTWMIMAMDVSDEGGSTLWIWLITIIGLLAIIVATGSVIIVKKRRSSLW